MDNHKERLDISINVREFEKENDFDFLMIEKCEDKLKEKKEYQCHCINEAQNFCECELVTDFEIINRSI